MLSVRPFQTSDLSDIVRIETAVFPTPWSAQAFLDCARWKEFWFRVVCLPRRRRGLRQRVVGYYIAQVVQTEAELHNIAVDPAYQQQGVGKQLLKDFLNRLKQEKVQNVFLLVRVSNRAAIQLYQQFGFCLSDTRPHYYEDTHEDALVFYKRLDS